jgi:glycogen debranching enzyme
MTIDLAAARAVLAANDRGGYTVPTARLYPFQWNWDSAFVAMGWACFDAARAWQEIEKLLLGQWADGRIPHIVFHAPADTYFPGPDVWGTHHTPPTSGIVQPPVLATATRAVFAADPDRARAEARLAAILPALARNHRWWHAARDPHGTGLVAILHPWESGMDNSPAWDTALARVPTTTETTIVRRDTGHVDPAMRPRAEDYQRFIHLVDTYRNAGWDAARMYAAAPFRVGDVATNAILLRAERDLLAMAERFTPAETGEIAARITRMETGLAAQWSEARGIFLSRDLIAKAPLDAATSAGFLPLWAGIGDARHLAATLARWLTEVRYAVPSTDPAEPGFEPLRYWRGPIWAIVNWMIAEGFAARGEEATAERIRSDTRALIGTAGFAEYFDPRTGAGAGGASFSWTAAIGLLLATP